ncbi:MAG: DUF3054 domain-containing protein [Nocardioides sp.]|uniref:DUF3054 domain-containing protein n=1 Tax=Nocardioides sp. TaxID=35761 RepID=UPI0039E49BA6
MRWFPVDVLMVSLFAAIGRLSHGEDLSPGGWWHTAWPFLDGLLVGWVLIWLAGRAGGGLGAGMVVWGCTLIGGMLLRALSDQGIAAPFVIVATVVLAAFVLGPRALVRISRRSSAA